MLVLRRAESALLGDLADISAQLSGLAGAALKALDALDAQVSELRGASTAEALVEVWLRALDTQRADARRAVRAIARALREVGTAARGVDANSDGGMPFGAGRKPCRGASWGACALVRGGGTAGTRVIF